MIINSIQGGGGIQLHVREWGNASAPSILFIHGWSQNHLCWSKQYESELATSYRLVAPDLRGHGMSEAPREANAYQNPQLWADDIAAILKELLLERPILVGWSYGGFIICDYIRAYGQENISGIVFAGAATTLHPPTLSEFIGPGFINVVTDAISEDLPTSLLAMRQFMHNCIARPLALEDLETALCWQMVVRPDVRGPLSRVRLTLTMSYAHYGCRCWWRMRDKTTLFCLLWRNTSLRLAQRQLLPGTMTSAMRPFLRTRLVSIGNSLNWSIMYDTKTHEFT